MTHSHKKVDNRFHHTPIKYHSKALVQKKLDISMNFHRNHATQLNISITNKIKYPSNISILKVISA